MFCCRILPFVTMCVAQKYIDDFKVTQDRAKAAQREAELEEQRRIAAYNASRSGRAEIAAKAKAEDDAIKEARYRAIVEEQEATRRRIEEEERYRSAVYPCFPFYFCRRVMHFKLALSSVLPALCYYYFSFSRQRLCGLFSNCACRWLLVEEEVELRRKQAEKDRLARSEAMKSEMIRANEEQRKIREQLQREADARERELTEQFLRKCRTQDDKERAAQQAREQVLSRISYRCTSTSITLVTVLYHDIRISQHATLTNWFDCRIALKLLVGHFARCWVRCC